MAIVRKWNWKIAFSFREDPIQKDGRWLGYSVRAALVVEVKRGSVGVQRNFGKQSSIVKDLCKRRHETIWTSLPVLQDPATERASTTVRPLNNF